MTESLLAIAEQFRKIFYGNQDAYGGYDLSEKNIKETTEGKKVVGRAQTVRLPVTDALWAEHLSGKTGIGIIPILPNNTAVFGAIDVDKYKNLNVQEIIDKIKAMAIPIMPFRSKSGGVHLFLFTREPVPASDIVDKLTDISSFLGLAENEIFPKQTRVLADRGDLGNWINMPYFNGDETNRYAYTENKSALSVHDFLEKIDSFRLTKEELKALSFKKTLTAEEQEFKEAPPCIKSLVTSGIPEGCRNTGMFAFAVFSRKAFPSEIEDKVQLYNSFCTPRLSATEIKEIVKQSGKKDYFYPCESSPCKDFCNKTACKRVKYGIGAGPGIPKLSNLTKFMSDPPIWFVDVDGHGRMELTTEQLYNQQQFHRKCIEALNIFPLQLKNTTWQQYISKALEDVTVIPVPLDSSPAGMFFSMLHKFLQRSPAREITELAFGKIFHHDGYAYFRVSDLLSFLSRMKFDLLRHNQVLSLLRDYGAEATKLGAVNTTDISVYKVKFTRMEKLNVPVIEHESPI